LSVIVASWNQGAVRLYQGAGYSVLAAASAIRSPGFPHKGDWVLMVKSLKESA